MEGVKRREEREKNSSAERRQRRKNIAERKLHNSANAVFMCSVLGATGMMWKRKAQDSDRLICIDFRFHSFTSRKARRKFPDEGICERNLISTLLEKETTTARVEGGGGGPGASGRNENLFLFLSLEGISIWRTRVKKAKRFD
jgi:hypothetical protein